jgi:hemoglobin
MTAVTIRELAASLLRVAASAVAVAAMTLSPCSAHLRAPLYERLGGEAGVSAIATALIDRVAADPRIGGSFKDTNLDHIKKMLAEQICDLSGGPCRYSGDSMKESHAGHHISEADFYGMVTELRDILRERHVSLGATNELLRLLAPMKRDIVEHASVAKR